MQRLVWFLLTCFLAVTLGAGRLKADPALDSIDSFAYVLQAPNLMELSASPYQLLVIDYSLDGSNDTAFSAAQIAALKASGKRVLAYLSIGEAEDYRFYFNPSWIEEHPASTCGKRKTKQSPRWLDDSNPNWCGNYKVRYWKRPWQHIIWGVRTGARESYLDRIIDAGFDGVYLDIIDGYEYWSEKRGAARHAGAARDMASFVIQLARYARVTRGQADFVVVPQNGAAIIDEISVRLRKRYLNTIQGIGAEDTFFYGEQDEDNDYSPQEVLATLRTYAAAGKRVLAIDYLLDPAKIAQFKALACAEGFVPQVSNRALDTLAYHAISGCAD